MTVQRFYPVFFPSRKTPTRDWLMSRLQAFAHQLMRCCHHIECYTAISISQIYLISSKPMISWIHGTISWYHMFIQKCFHLKIVQYLFNIMFITYDGFIIFFSLFLFLWQRFQFFRRLEFGKDFFWERLSLIPDIPVRVFTTSGIEEIKDVRQDEFTHWVPDEALSPRKEIAWENYNLIKQGLVEVFPDRFSPKLSER